MKSVCYIYITQTMYYLVIFILSYVSALPKLTLSKRYRKEIVWVGSIKLVNFVVLLPEITKTFWKNTATYLYTFVSYFGCVLWSFFAGDVFLWVWLGWGLYSRVCFVSWIWLLFWVCVLVAFQSNANFTNLRLPQNYTLEHLLNKNPNTILWEGKFLNVNLEYFPFGRKSPISCQWFLFVSVCHLF